MKRLFLILSVACAAAAGCDKVSDLTPVVILNNNHGVFFASVDDGSYELGYSVSGIYDGWTVTAESNVDWITGVRCGASSKLTFNVQANDTGESRSGCITVVCTNPSGRSGSAELVVCQEDNPVYYREDKDLPYAYIYNPTISDDGKLYYYTVRFTDSEYSSLNRKNDFYTFNFCSPLREDGLMLPADGRYEIRHGSEKAMTISDDSFFYSSKMLEDYGVEFTDFLSGAVTIVCSAETDAEGNTEYHIWCDADVTDELGLRYHMMFEM